MHANKGDFVGRATLIDVTADIVSRRLCCLTVDDGRSVVLGHELVFPQGQPARYVTSATFDHTIGQPIAYLVTSARPKDAAVAARRGDTAFEGAVSSRAVSID